MTRTVLALALLATLAACGAPEQMSFAPTAHPMADVNITPVPTPLY